MDQDHESAPRDVEYKDGPEPQTTMFKWRFMLRHAFSHRQLAILGDREFCTLQSRMYLVAMFETFMVQEVMCMSCLTSRALDESFLKEHKGEFFSVLPSELPKWRECMDKLRTMTQDQLEQFAQRDLSLRVAGMLENKRSYVNYARS